MNASTLGIMKAAPRWLLRNGKVPHYSKSLQRRQTTDTPEDRAQLVTFDDAEQLLQQHQQDGKATGFELGFALGPDDQDGCWQGIDLDHVAQNSLHIIQEKLPGYVERSPSDEGVHAIGYGQSFAPLNRHEVGIEAYAKGRFFTFTGKVIRDPELTDLAGFVSTQLRSNIAHAGDSSGVSVKAGSLVVAPEVYDELEEALKVIPADHYDVWFSVLQALKRLSDTDRAYKLARDWSATSDNPAHTPEVFERKWTQDLNDPGARTYKTIFKLADQKDPTWRRRADEKTKLNKVPERWREIPLQDIELEPVDYLIDDFLARALMTFVGKPGIGKSTAMIAFGAVVAGFEIPDCPLRAPVKGRKVIYITEDTTQFKRNLFGLNRNSKIPMPDLAGAFVLLPAHRVNYKELLSLRHFVERHTTISDTGIRLRPWLVFDTTSASFHLEDENSNAEVASTLALLKEEFYEKLDCSVCLVAHSTKHANRKDFVAEPRGAGAWAGDTTLTSGIFDEGGTRFIMLGKRRYKPLHTELKVSLQWATEVVIDPYGRDQVLRLESVLFNWSNSAERLQVGHTHTSDHDDRLLAFLVNAKNAGNIYSVNGLNAVRGQIPGHPGKDTLSACRKRLKNAGFIDEIRGKPGRSDGWQIAPTESGMGRVAMMPQKSEGEPERGL